jgi:hypothetical protein
MQVSYLKILRSFHAALILCVICINPLWADDEGEVKKQTDVSFIVSTEPGLGIGIEQRFIFPFLQGMGPLAEENNITVKLGAQVDPVSFNFFADAVWTPLALLNLSLGTWAATGWNYELAGDFVNGMGLYQPMNHEEPEERARGSGLDGAVWNVHGSAALLFDFAAVFPGDWNHVVISFSNVLNYQNYTKAEGSEQWYFRNDGNLYQNWFSYYFSGVLGYQMPIFIDMTGLMFELSLPLYNPQSGKPVSGREPEMICSLVTDLKIGGHFNLTVLTQLRNPLNHPVTADYERKWEFYRTLIVGTWHLF